MQGADGLDPRGGSFLARQCDLAEKRNGLIGNHRAAAEHLDGLRAKLRVGRGEPEHSRRRLREIDAVALHLDHQRAERFGIGLGQGVAQRGGDLLALGPLDRLEVRPGRIRARAPPFAIPIVLARVEAAERLQNDLARRGVGRLRQSLDQSIDHGGGVLQLQRPARAVQQIRRAGRIKGREADLGRAQLREALHREMRDHRIAVRHERQNAGRGLRLAQSAQRGHGLQPHARIRIGQRADERRGGHGGGGLAVGQRAQGELAHFVVLRQPEQRGLRGRARQLIQREDGGGPGRGRSGGSGEGFQGADVGGAVIAPQDFPLRIKAGESAGRADQFEQLRLAGFFQIGKRGELPARRCHAHHVAGVRPGVVEGRALPARNVEPPRTVHVEIRRTLQLDKLALTRLPARAVVRQRMAHDRIGAPLHRVQPAPESFRETRLVHEQRAAGRAAAVVRERLDHFVAELFVERRVAVLAAHQDMREAHVPAIAVVGVVAREEVHLRRDGHVINVALAVRNDFQPGAVRAHAHHAAAVQLDRRAVLADGVGRAVVAAGDVEKAIDAHPHAVHGVVGPAKFQVEAQPLHDGLAAVGHAVAVVVEIRGDEGRMLDVKNIVLEPDAARAVHRRKGGELVGFPVAVRIGAADDAATVRLGVERAVLIDADVEIAVGRGGEAGRVADIGGRGEHRDLPTGRGLDALGPVGGGRGDGESKEETKNIFHRVHGACQTRTQEARFKCRRVVAQRNDAKGNRQTVRFRRGIPNIQHSTPNIERARPPLGVRS